MRQFASTITLFTEPQPAGRPPSTLLISILLHCAVFGLLSLALRHAPRIDDSSLNQRYTVRLLNLRQPPPQLHWQPAPAAAQSAMRTASGGESSASSMSRQLAQAAQAPQTLVQPDLPPNLLLPQKTPVPMVLMWTPENIPVRKIVPPPPQQAATPQVRPSLEAPNRQLALAEIKISATQFATATPSLPPSTTTPIDVRGPQAVERVPETASKLAAPPTPASVMSLSRLRMPEGTIALPPVNEIAPSRYSGPLSPVSEDDSPQTGSGDRAGKQNGSGAGRNAGDHGDQTAANGPAMRNGTDRGQGSGVIAGSGTLPSTDRVDLPKDGQFGVVVVGSSLEDEYPEVQGIWADRLAYTVYLHVGLAKSWILQYSAPLDAEAAGNLSRPEAPWPYLIVRPHLAPGDLDVDAVLVHGFVNTAGRFERLAIVFPAEFAQTKFVLSALQQWQFRPAMRNGQIAAVEVLLIIPGEQD